MVFIFYVFHSSKWFELVAATTPTTPHHAVIQTGPPPHCHPPPQHRTAVKNHTSRLSFPLIIYKPIDSQTMLPTLRVNYATLASQNSACAIHSEYVSNNDLVVTILPWWKIEINYTFFVCVWCSVQNWFGYKGKHTNATSLENLMRQTELFCAVRYCTLLFNIVSDSDLVSLHSLTNTAVIKYHVCCVPNNINFIM